MRVAAAVPGVVALVASAVIGVCLAVPGQTGVPGNSGTVYNPSRWVLLAVLAAAAVVLLRARRRDRVQVAAVVAAVMAVQLAGTGVFAFRRWVATRGAAGYGAGNFTTVRTLALVLAAAGLCALGAALLAVSRSTTERAPRAAVVPAVPVGGLIAVGLPWVLGAGDPELTDLTSLLGYAVLYSLPLGAAVLGSCLLPRTAAVAGLAATAASAVLCLALAIPQDRIAHPVLGFGAVAVGAALVLARRLTADRTR